MSSAKSKQGGEPEVYISSLPSDVRQRYDEKTSVLGVDPYTLEPNAFGRDRMAWPDVTFSDLYYHLVCSTNWYSKEQMKHFKSLEAFKFFQDDWIREVLHKQINGYHVLKAKVTHSMRVSEKPLEPWIIVTEDGSVHSAHCTCMAGLGEACSHIGAVLFCLETCARIRKEVTPTDLPAYWIFPTTTRLVTQFQRVKDMNLQSAAKRRRLQNLDLPQGQGINNNNHHQREQDVDIPAPTYGEEQDFFRKLSVANSDAAILSVTESFAKNFEPKTLRIGLPPDLGKLYQPDLSKASKEQILQQCESVQLAFSEEQADLVEMKTRGQSKHKLWFTMRTGRITASNFYAVCHTSVEKPSKSLLKKVCAPAKGLLKCPPLEWGRKHEKTAREQYKLSSVTCHQKFQVRESGLFLSPEYPVFGASPDGIVFCKCCGEGCLEIKCPYSLREKGNYQDLLWLKINEQDKFVLDAGHEYYFQVQCQIFLTGRRYCDFVVWAPHLPLLIHRIYPDKELWEDISDRAARFHQQCVMPELCAHYFSTQSALTQTQNAASQTRSQNKFCICEGPDDGRRMIRCDNENCRYVWFHVDCISMKRIPKGSWICKDCRNARRGQ